VVEVLREWGRSKHRPLLRQPYSTPVGTMLQTRLFGPKEGEMRLIPGFAVALTWGVES